MPQILMQMTRYFIKLINYSRKKSNAPYNEEFIKNTKHII